jgi:hypothetical protein
MMTAEALALVKDCGLLLPIRRLATEVDVGPELGWIPAPKLHLHVQGSIPLPITILKPIQTPYQILRF